jgi:hypothetical protein
MFAPIGVGATDPYFPGLDTASPALGLTYMAGDAATNGRGGSSTISEMLMPPLSGDDYLLQNMQALGGTGSNTNSYDWGQSNSE